jgi:hypothetical protein
MAQTGRQASTREGVGGQKSLEQGIMLDQNTTDVEQHMEPVAPVTWQDTTGETDILKKCHKSPGVPFPRLVPKLVELQDNLRRAQRNHFQTDGSSLPHA